MSHTHRWRQIIEEDITEVEEEERDTGAYYAAWPKQAYIEGFAISSAIALTHEDTWGLEEWIAKEGEISQLGNVAEVEKK